MEDEHGPVPASREEFSAPRIRVLRVRRREVLPVSGTEQVVITKVTKVSKVTNTHPTTTDLGLRGSHQSAERLELDAEDTWLSLICRPCLRGVDARADRRVRI